MTTLTLDLRDLPPPQPLQRTLEALDAADADTSIEVWTPQWPSPLLDLLQQRGRHFEASLLADGTARVIIHAEQSP